MNRIFYIIVTLIILSIIVFLNLNNEVDNAAVEPSMEIADTKKVTATNVEIEFPVIHDVTPIKQQESAYCIVDKGVALTQACDKFKNIEKMDLTEFTNLKMHDDILTMFNKGELMNPFNLGVSIFELGKSDQGKVYQIIIFQLNPSAVESEIEIDQNDERVEYFFNSQLENYSLIVKESDISVSTFSTSNVHIENIVGANMTIKDAVQYKSIIDSSARCLSSWQALFLNENGVDYQSLVACEEALSVYVSSFTGLNYNLDVLGEDVVLDGGGLLLRDKEMNSLVELCFFDVEYMAAKTLEINPKTIETFNCKYYNNITPEIMGEFVNMKSFYIEGSEPGDTKNYNDLSFFKNYRDLEELIIADDIEFDLKLLQGMRNLKKLELIGVTILNANEFDSSSIQLNSINLKKSKIDNVKFLEQQFELTTIDLSYTNIQSMPMLGFSGSLLELNLKGNALSNIEGFEKFNNLKKLDVSRNKIKYMSNLNLELDSLESVNITFNPLDCSDPYLNYSPIVKSSCNRKLKP
ncbi:hypothetical protein [Marinicellulosiphila megalodicopiae]|uniref:hypothetical protein n=1 Tax=Marinicellulosiphila megalodicopiae TaxID=2724896 RepID=UPI003BB15C77